MKLSDAPSTSVSIEIHAPAPVVFDLITDVNTPAETSSEFQGAEWLDGAHPGVGAKFVGRNAHPALGAWETTAVVSKFVPNRTFEYTISSEGQPPGSTWRYDITELDGSVRLTQFVQIGPGPSGLSYALDKMPEKEDKILRRRLEEHETNMRANVEAIKSRAESAGREE